MASKCHTLPRRATLNSLKTNKTCLAKCPTQPPGKQRHSARQTRKVLSKPDLQLRRFRPRAERQTTGGAFPASLSFLRRYAIALKQFTDRGWDSDVGFIRPDETAGPAVERQLRSANYDCVVVGGGVRLPPRNLALFEVVINAIRTAAPGAAIAFNTRPDDSADAAARWVTAGSRTA